MAGGGSSSSSSAHRGSGSSSSPKKANLLDHPSLKHLLDESVSQAVASRGFVEDVRMGNLRILIGAICVAAALSAHFYPGKFPENRGFLVACVVLYVVACGLLMLLSRGKHKDAILFTYPPSGAFNSPGLMISSKLPRFSDMYTLTVASADPTSIFANRPAQLTKSVTKWFTKDGYLVEGLFRKDVERLIDEYTREFKKRDSA